MLNYTCSGNPANKRSSSKRSNSPGSSQRSAYSPRPQFLNRVFSGRRPLLLFHACVHHRPPRIVQAFDPPGSFNTYGKAERSALKAQARLTYLRCDTATPCVHSVALFFYFLFLVGRRRGANENDRLTLSEMALAGGWAGVMNAPIRQVFERVKSVMQVRFDAGGDSVPADVRTRRFSRLCAP